MTKRQIRNAALKAIFKDGKTHTETFKELRPETDLDGNSLAEIVSGIPSKEKYEATRPIWTAYLGVLGLIVLLRLFYIYLVVQELGSSISPVIILPMVLFSVFVPAYGIYGVLKGMRHTLMMVVVFLGLGIFRGLQNSNFQINWDSFIVFGLIAALIVLTILLWNKWKTPFTKRVEIIETDSGEKKQPHYQFEDDTNSNAELLDDVL